MKRTWLLAVVVLINVYAAAQNFGGFPPSTHWRQINTDTARIIYTNGAQAQAERISNLIHQQAADADFSLGRRMRKVDIVLQSHTTLANGFVGLAPFRSAFYLVPSSNLFEFGNLPWADNLAVHEYRHVQQYNNFNHGVSKAFYYLFGEQGQAFANALSVPDWFFEGDAVHAETAFTQQGRGRLPFFLSGYNSLWLEDKDYSWMKLRNGSMKDYVPDHYQLGYLLTNYGYLKYGSDFWRKVTQDATAFKGLFYPFQKAIKRHAGVDYRTFRKQAFQFYKDQLGKTQSSKRNNRTTVTNYYFPQFISGDSLLYVKTAYDRLPAFYIRDGKGEHRLAQRSITTEDWFSYRNGTIAYTAFSTDPRWSLYDYSDIVLLDVKTGHERRISEKEKMFTPDLSPSGKKLAAIRYTDSLQTELQIIQTANGIVEKVLLPGAGNQYANPRFAGEDSIVAVSKNENSRAALLLIDLRDTATTEIIIPYSLNTISVPFVANDKVYFVSNASGNDDLFSVDIKSRKIVQLTQDETGNYYPSVFGDSLVWSHFTAEGLLLKQASLNAMQQQVISHQNWQQTRQQYPVADADVLHNAPVHPFTDQPYSNTSHLLNFHSWAPNYVDPEFTFSLYSDNVLNTFSL